MVGVTLTRVEWVRSLYCFRRLRTFAGPNGNDHFNRRVVGTWLLRLAVLREWHRRSLNMGELLLEALSQHRRPILPGNKRVTLTILINIGININDPVYEHRHQYQRSGL